MAKVDAQLSFDHHLNFFRGLGALTGDAKRDAHCYREAEHMHALCISNAIRDLHIDAGNLSRSIKSAEANLQIRFGVSRRSKFIWLSLRNLLSLVLPDRGDPLQMEQVEEVARDLNVIYINIRGTLDNLAWFLLDLFGDDRTRKLAPMRIGLFVDDFIEDKNLTEVANFIKPFRDWNKELSGRRDPAAHRIPLSVPPAIIDSQTRDEYERALEQYNHAISDAFKHVDNWEVASPKFELAEVLHERLQRIGKFIPLFTHHPERGAMKIYPTVPEDIGQLIRIAHGIFDIANAKLSPSEKA